VSRARLGVICLSRTMKDANEATPIVMCADQPGGDNPHATSISEDKTLIEGARSGLSAPSSRPAAKAGFGHGRKLIAGSECLPKPHEG